jgi:hypothetical protein
LGAAAYGESLKEVDSKEDQAFLMKPYSVKKPLTSLDDSLSNSTSIGA